MLDQHDEKHTLPLADDAAAPSAPPPPGTVTTTDAATTAAALSLGTLRALGDALSPLALRHRHMPSKDGALDAAEALVDLARASGSVAREVGDAPGGALAAVAPELAAAGEAVRARFEPAPVLIGAFDTAE